MFVQADPPRVLTGPVAPMRVEAVTLDGQYVRLEPLSIDHFGPLCEVVIDPDIWRWFPAQVDTADDMRRFIETALRLRDEGSTIPFTTIYKPDNRVVGGSRYLTIDAANHHIEIGATYVGKPWQRTSVNTEAKYLMLRHAFETLGCLRVEFKTDFLNVPSRNALARLGATEEGVFRNHIICASGRVRNSVYFSITDEEWPTIKANLEAKLARPYPPKS